MPTFREQVQVDQENVFFDRSVFADSAFYESFDGSRKGISVIADIGDTVQGGAFGSSSADVARFFVLKSEVSTPQARDIVTHSGLDWRVTSVIPLNDYVWSLAAERKERITK